jgi:rubrerythrin
MPENYIDNYNEAIQLAISRESEVEQFYEEIAGQVHEPEAKSLLKRLAIEEKKHQKMLHTFAGAVANNPEGAFLPPEDFFFHFSKKDMQTTEDIFKIAIQQEEVSLNFYARFLVYFFGTGHENIFKDIFNMEADHKDQLERNMKQYINR